MSRMNKNRVDKIQNKLTVDSQPNGFLKIRANLTRVGIFVYKYSDGTTVREFRSPEEVFREDSISTLDQSTLSLYHPPVFIDTDNYKEYSVGNVSKISQDSNFISGDLMVARKDAITAIEEGVREISCGYSCDVTPQKGTYNGMEYDAIQTNIKYNHVAIVPKGRAGSDVRMHLDADHVVGEYMTLEEQLSEATAKYDAAKADASELSKELISLKEELATLKTLNEATQQKADSLSALEENFNQRVTERVSLETVAKNILKSDSDLRSKTERDIKEMVIESVYGDAIKLDGRDSVAIDALFEASVLRQPTTAATKVDTVEVQPLETTITKSKKVDIAAIIAAKTKEIN